MTTHTTTNKDLFTVEQIADLRDGQQLSWAKVADELTLGSPGAARRAYTALVRPHTDSTLATRATASAKVTPVDLTGMDLAELRDTITGRTLVVDRGGDTTERIACAKVTSVRDGTINFNDGNKRRTVKADSVVALA